MKVVAAFRTWDLVVEDDVVKDCEFASFVGKTLTEVQVHCIRRGWLLKR